MRCYRRSALGSLLTAATLLLSGSTALAQDTPADDPGTQPTTTQATVDRAKAIRDQACANAVASAWLSHPRGGNLNVGCGGM
jgi:hypothetical protein